MKIKIFIFLLFTSVNFSGQHMTNIIPTPQKIILPKISTYFSLGEKVKIEINELSNNKLIISQNLLTDKLKNVFGINITNKEAKSIIRLNIVSNFDQQDGIPQNFSEEAYTLEIKENLITISSIDSKGIYYGVLTLIQILEEQINVIPVCKIIDYPNLKIRGVSDDISRGQVSTLENFKRIIEFISEYKMNTYMPYIEDVIQFDKFPQIGKGRGALTKTEIKKLIKYAEEHFVEIIPIFQTPGHYENILSQKEFIPYADFPGAASLDVTNPKTYDFLESMLKEIFELFPSKFFHIGADESYDVGLGNSRKLLADSDLATIHSNHYNKVYQICKKYNKQVMMYGDIILSYPQILDKIPKDITIVDWHYFPRFDYPSTKIFSEAGFNYVVSPSVWNFNSAFPENFFAIPNIQILIEDGINNNSTGMINSSWGDFGAETFREYNLYGYAWSAQCAWNIKTSDIKVFNKIFFKQFFGTNDERIETIYKNLSEPTNQLVWNNVWRHPLLDYRKPDWRQISFPQTSKYFLMKEANNYLNEIGDIKVNVSKNGNYLDLLKFTLSFKEWFILKQKTQILLHRLLKNINVDKDLVKDLINRNINSLIELKKQYSLLWKLYNKIDNLWMIEEKFERLIAYFIEIKKQIETESIGLPIIQSKWIYYPNVENEFIWNVKFAKTVNIDNKINSAQLQIIADTFAKLIINGKVIDSVYTKRSGSLWIEQQRIKLLDITNFLSIGENKIIVEAKNYYDNKTPGINIISEIITEKDTIMLMTDDNWKVNKFGTDNWVKVEVIQNPLEIIAPNFSTKRKSWIER